MVVIVENYVSVRGNEYSRNNKGFPEVSIPPPANAPELSNILLLEASAKLIKCCRLSRNSSVLALIFLLTLRNGVRGGFIL
jgi:hypothetical protein